MDDPAGAATGPTGSELNLGIGGDVNFSGFGTKIHIWNICDTSRIRSTNVLVNGCTKISLRGLL